MSPHQRHHRHAVHARDSRPQIVNENDIGFDAVKRDDVLLEEPKLVRRQVLTVYKTLTVTRGHSSATAVAAVAADNASATAHLPKASVTSSADVASKTHSTITITSTRAATPSQTTANESKSAAAASSVAVDSTSVTPTATEIKSAIASSAAAAATTASVDATVSSSASVVTTDVVPSSTSTLTDASTLLTVIVTASSASPSSSLAISSLVSSAVTTTSSEASTSASSTSSAPSDTTLGASSSFSGNNNNGSTDMSSSSTSSGSLSAGARAGIIIGAIAGAILIFALAFLLVRRMKQRRQEEDSANEKANAMSSFSFGGPANTAYPPPAHTMTEKAPRLSIRVSRPVSGLLPLSLLSGRATRSSTGALQSAATADAAGGYAKMSSPPVSIRGSTGSAASVQNGVQAVPPEGSSSPTASYASSISSKSSGEETPVLVVPAPQDPFSPPSPTIGGPAGAAGVGSTSNVHRAIMDFNPTMHDELGLKEGQLVRILHEYDDGWALCVKLDRSAQGVCPRSCLSTRALRPRPKRGVKRPVPSGSAMKTAERNITDLPIVNTEAANASQQQRPGMAEKLPSTPTIQVFAPDSERPIEIA
ncbi:hypothetical protein V1509DRAFT_191618 [Lipomyces kononenkoae]